MLHNIALAFADGFHKVMQDESGAARHDKYCSGRYQQPFFKRGQEELLIKIKRKVTSSTGDKRLFRKAKVCLPFFFVCFLQISGTVC